MLFDFYQSKSGFCIVGSYGGSALINFFGRDGSLRDAITLRGLTNGYYGSQASGGVNQIAGVTITNDDSAGIGLDDLKHNVPGTTVPEPTTLTLLGCGYRPRASSRRRLVESSI